MDYMETIDKELEKKSVDFSDKNDKCKKGNISKAKKKGNRKSK